jgi:transcriptional regulator with XRE-family HTH domain
MGADWFAGRLRELRTAAGLSRRELAEKAGLKEGGIRDIEQGINNPTWPTVLALAAALGVSCEAFNVPPTEDTSPPERGRPKKTKPADGVASIDATGQGEEKKPKKGNKKE